MTTEVIFPVYNESDTLSEQIKIFNDFFDKEFKKIFLLRLQIMDLQITLLLFQTNY